MKSKFQISLILALAPHLGSATEKTRAAMAFLAVDNIIAALDGKPMPAPL
jgi:glyoxylate reductase